MDLIKANFNYLIQISNPPFLEATKKTNLLITIFAAKKLYLIKKLHTKILNCASELGLFLPIYCAVETEIQFFFGISVGSLCHIHFTMYDAYISSFALNLSS